MRHHCEHKKHKLVFLSSTRWDQREQIQRYRNTSCTNLQFLVATSVALLYISQGHQELLPWMKPTESASLAFLCSIHENRLVLLGRGCGVGDWRLVEDEIWGTGSEFVPTSVRHIFTLTASHRFWSSMIWAFEYLVWRNLMQSSFYLKGTILPGKKRKPHTHQTLKPSNPQTQSQKKALSKALQPKSTIGLGGIANIPSFPFLHKSPHTFPILFLIKFTDNT